MFALDIQARIWVFFSKFFRRFKVRYYLCRLERIKNAQTARKERIRKARGPMANLCDCLFVLVCVPVGWIQFWWSIFATIFTADKYPNYLKLMLMEGTRESRLLNMSLFYVFGTLFSIAVFYTEVFFLAKFDMYTLFNSLLILVVCTFLPLISVTGQALALLVIPTSAITTIRACILSFIFIHMNLIAWSNVNNNLDNTMDAIACEKTVLVEFSQTLDFRLAAFPWETNMSPDNITVISLVPWNSWWFGPARIVDGLMMVSKFVYRTIAWILCITNSIKQMILEFLDRTIWSWLSSGTIFGINIGGLISSLVDFCSDMVDLLKRELGGGKLFSSIDFSPLENIKNMVSVKYHANYVYKVKTNTNVSFQAIFRNAKDDVLNNHSYIGIIEAVVRWVLELYIVRAFFKIFGSSLKYLVLFRYVRSYDNFYITPHFLELDKKKQSQGVASLFPLYLFEKFLYVQRTDMHFAIHEMSFFINLILANLSVSYAGFLFLVDTSAYEICAFTSKWIHKIADDLSTYPSIMRQSDVPVLNYLFKNDRFATNFESLRGRIRRCAPKPHPLEWEMYNMALLLVILWWVCVFVEPFLKRTRSYICERLYPQTVEGRCEWLYSTVVLTRIVTKLVSYAFNPIVAKFLFYKQGMANPLNQNTSPANAAMNIKATINIFRNLMYIWPFYQIFKCLGVLKALPSCAKCNKAVYPSMDTFKCPKWNCDCYYCENCFGDFRRCVKCQTFVREGDSKDEQSEESDSSADHF